MSDIDVFVDGKPYNPSETVIYRGMMLSEVPNLAFSMGYINASWTLRSDLTARYVCRLVNHMDANGYAECRPHLPETPLEGLRQGSPLSASYTNRTRDLMPKVSDTAPWSASLYYVLDKAQVEFSSFRDQALQFKGATSAPRSRL
mmetsp:Transcript_105793/g.341173  ORF Transcript_105793/g.341173 Transcript_105793/m.341173 type:complete len:145 (+) Transcript_105793:1151-1585(+)